ncbi:M14 family metallopeptidase [Congregibacter variabilis]|uniref:M14 family metallopeptidase n=1 Tax=Congregibacter variabilis TaxID=3081200 RepID=A0ABZ0I4Z5_9GAMM|nr:M14 family metallopeptidase [Congregibacter sp. IMCC43200]
MRRFRFIRDPGASLAGSNPDALLDNLGGPVCILFSGRDTTRTRALVTLLHGNEPSGLFALHRWLLSAQQPAVNLLVIVASVHAALESPRFSHRMLPRARDLNRCFKPPFDDEQGRLAEEILELLRLHRPEAIVDMHNTSGSGPSFGVCTHLDRQHDALVSLFTRRLVVSHLNLGALMDISDASCPTVTIEVGGRQDEEAHTLAYDGLQRFASAQRVLANEDEVEWGIEILRDPIRLELCEGVTLAYDDKPRPGFDITLRSDIEHHNFGEVNPHTPLGWVKDDPQALFRAVDAFGRCAVTALVRCEDGVLYPSQGLKLFMITTNASIAQSDCLFYAVATEQNLPLTSDAKSLA